MTLEMLVLAGLATWRISSLIIREDGPGRVFFRLRTFLGRYFVTLLECLWCLSVWVGLGVGLLALSAIWWVLIPFAMSAVAIGMDNLVYHDHSDH